MSDQFIGEIRMFAGSYAPQGWAMCNGQLLPIAQNTALFSLLGNMYGGDGRTTFALPNLQGSAPMHQGQGPGLTPRSVGEAVGEQTVTLDQSEMPFHTHGALVGGMVQSAPGPQVTWGSGSKGGANIYTTSISSGTVAMSPVAIQPSGSSQPHNNMQPYLALTFIIAQQGVFPSRG